MSASGPSSVLHVITTLDRGGAEHALLHLVRAQVQSGQTTAVAYLKGPGELAAAFRGVGAEVHDLALRGVRGVGAYGRLGRLLREFAPRVVHTHLFKADTLGAAVVGKPRPGRPILISTKHNEDVYLVGRTPRPAAVRTLARRVAARANAVIAISDGVARFIHDTLGDAPRRVTTIRYGIPQPEREGHGDAFRALHGISADAPLLLCVAQFVAQKDHDTLFAALDRLEAAPRLALLGRGEREDELRRRAPTNVLFAGFTDDPADAYAAADVLVLSSRHEGLGVVVLEAARHGVPAVGTRVGGLAEAIQDGVTGVLVPPGDPAALATALSRLLDDAELRHRMGRAAAERVAALHSVTAYRTAHDALYAELCGATT